MHLKAIIVASVAALATAKKDTCSPKSPCKNNAALSAIQKIQATAFCADLLGLETTTVTATATTTETAAETLTDVTTVVDGQTAIEVATQIVEETVTETVDAEAVLVTSTIVRTDVLESPVTETVTTTLVATSTTYPRNGPMRKRNDQAPAQPDGTPTELKDFSPAALETACSCLSPSPETMTTTLTATATSHATSHVAQTTTLTSIQTATSTLLQTTTNTEIQTRPPSTIYTTVYTTSSVTSLTTATITATAQGSTTVLGPSFNFVQSYSNNCVPYNYINLYADVQGVPNTFDGIFQWCAQVCARDSACTQIWVAVNNPITQSGKWCMTGGGTADKTWDASEIQCNYPPIGRSGYWYGRGN